MSELELLKQQLVNIDIESLYPRINKNNELKILHLVSKQLKDISFLKNFTELEMLFLSSNKIEDISVLKHLKKLKHLSLSSNSIKDISVLKHLKKLKHLSLESNLIKDISIFKKLKNLTEIHIYDTPIKDFSILEYLTNLKILYLKLITSLKNIKFLHNLQKLEYLHINKKGLSGILISEISKLLINSFALKQLTISIDAGQYVRLITNKIDVFNKDKENYKNLASTVFPPPPLLKLGYDNFDFYYRDYFVNHYQEILSGNLNYNDILKEIYQNYTKKELPCAIRNIYVSHYKEIRELSINNIATNHQDKIIQDPQWIFLTGENGYGKTLILQAIVIALFGNQDGDIILSKIDKDTFFYAEFNNKETFINVLSNHGYIHTENKDGYNIEFKRKNMTSFKKFVAYGASRLNKNPRPFNNNQTYSIFNSYGELLDIEDRLITWENRASQKQYFKSAKEILLNLLSPYIIDIKIISEGTQTFIKYEEIDSDILKSFNELASGYKSIITMIGDLIIRLSEHQAEITDFKNLEGIVLIDEIDLHLHPKWQKQLVKKLNELFPKIQFIASTHSPIPLLGAPPKRTAIFNVNRTKEEGITVKRLFQIEKELPNLLPNVLLTSPVFGLDNIKSEYNENIDDVIVDDNYNDREKYDNLDKEIDDLFDENDWADNDLFKE